MKSIEGLKLINRIHKNLITSGFDAKKLITELKKLRPYSIEDEDPVLAKVIRLTYEHIEKFNGFFIPIPAEEEIKEEKEEEEEIETVEEIETPIIETLEEQVESLEYLFSLIQDSTNKNNRIDLIDYRSKLVEYADTNN